jgi:catechol 2,3-dioxygenase-like lactoylglutathione lyase family enzyme
MSKPQFGFVVEYVKDIETVKRFYVEVLGFNVEHYHPTFVQFEHLDGKAPLDLRLTFWGHKDQARQCVERMLQWQPGRIIFSHGRWYDSNAVAELRRAFRWLGKI